MYDELYDGFSKTRKVMYVLSFFILLLSTVAGSVYLIVKYGNSSDIESYLNGVISRLSGDIDGRSIMISSIKESALVVIIFFVCSFFKPGILVIGGEIARRGFVSGFTVSAFIKTYGTKGIIYTLCMMPQTLIMVPALMMLASINASLSINRAERTKNLWMMYIFFIVASMSIFCVGAICEGFLTTIFMKMVS